MATSIITDFNTGAEVRVLHGGIHYSVLVDTQGVYLIRYRCRETVITIDCNLEEIIQFDQSGREYRVSVPSYGYEHGLVLELSNEVKKLGLKCLNQP